RACCAEARSANRIGSGIVGRGAAMLRRTFVKTSAATALLATLSNKLSLAKGSAVIDDPLLAPWTGPHGGFPRFDKVTAAKIKPALLKAMELDRGEIAAIAAATEPATFENTIAALESSGRPFNRVISLFNVYRSTMSDKTMQKIEQEMAPVLAAFADEIVQNEALFARIKTVYDGRKTAQLSPEQLRLVEIVYRNFARQGAALPAKDK